MIDEKQNKKVRIFTKDSFNFTGKLILINEIFVQIIDLKTDKEMTFPIQNVTRIEEVKE